jgi:hypothetical protein
MSGNYGLTIEATGRLAKAHGLFDDFVYHPTKWSTGSSAPNLYSGAASNSGTIGIISTEFGGVLEMNAAAILNSSATLVSSSICRCNPSLFGKTRMMGFFRVAISDTTVSGMVIRVALTSSGTYDFGFEWSSANKFWQAYTYKPAGSVYAYSGSLCVPTSGEYTNLYCRSLDDSNVHFWTDGGLSTVPMAMPTIFSAMSSDMWGLRSYIDNTGGSSDTCSLLLDTWEIREDRAVSGTGPT